MVAKVTQLPRSGRHASGPDQTDSRLELGRARRRAHLVMLAGGIVSIAWIGLCAFYAHSMLGWDLAARMLPHEIGALLAGAVMPLALLWVIITYFRRGFEIRHYTEALQRQYELLTYPAEDAESRIQEISDSLKRQSEALSRASDKAAVQMRELSGLVEKQSAALGETTERTAKDVTEIRESLNAQLAELNQLAQSLAERRSALKGEVGQLSEHLEKVGRFTLLDLIRWAWNISHCLLINLV